MQVHINEAICSFTIFDVFTNNTTLCDTTSKLTLNPDLNIFNEHEQKATPNLNTLTHVLLHNLLITDLMQLNNMY